MAAQSERKNDIASLLDREASFRAVLDDLPVGVVILDATGRPLQWNARFVELRGFEPEASKWLSGLHPEDRDGVVESWKLSAERGEPWSAVYRLVQPDGDVVWISGRANPLYAGGKLAGYVRTLEDITKLKEAEQRLREVNAALQMQAGRLEEEVQARTEKMQQAFVELDRLSYSIVHDMRAPLRTLQGFSALLIESYSDRLDEQGQDLLRRIATAARKQDELITGVLAYHSYVRDKFPLSPTNLDDVVSNITNTYADLQPPKVQIVVRKPLGWVIAHDTLLTQAISALLNNAAKFVAPGTRPEISIWSQREDPNIRLWVQDNGIGIAPNYHEKIFDVFQTLHDPEKYGGFGAGLPLAKKALERMNGSIGVESNVGVGSKFWIRLEAVTNQQRPPA